MNVKHLTKAVLMIGAIFFLLVSTIDAAYREEERDEVPAAIGTLASRVAGGAVLKQVTVEGGAFSSPAVSGGYVFIGTFGGDVLCFDAVTGSKSWDFPTNDQVSSSPVVSGGNVYAGSYDGNVYCLDAGSGNQLWAFAAGAPVGSSPAVYGGNVYAASDLNSDKTNKTVFCLNALTGNRIWGFATGSDIESSPAVADGYVYIGSSDSKMYCLTADAGKKVWDFTTGGIVVSSPAVTEGLVYAGSFDGRLYCLDALTGKKVWDFNTGQSIASSSPALANGFVYIMNTNGTVYCLDAQTGTKEWEFATFSVALLSSPAVTGKYVYVKSTDGTVYCLNALTGAVVWKSVLGETDSLGFFGSSPAIAGGYLYVGGQDLYYLATAPDETSSWPMYRENPARTGAPTPPAALFTAAPISGNAPLAVTFTDASTGVIDSWSWDFGDGNKSSEQKPQHTFNTAGIYSITLTATGPGGDDTLTKINYITVSRNAPQADFSSNVASGTAPLAVQFTDTSTGTITSYTWNFGDGSTSTEKNPQHTYSQPGTYDVTLSVTGPEGSDREIKQGYITVAAAPASFSLSGTVSGDRRAGVTIFLNGSQQQTDTGADGTYSFPGLTAGTYTIVPFKNATTFVPPSRNVKIQGKNVDGIDFIAKANKPEIEEAYASSANVPADGTTPVIFFAQVFHPLGMQNISSVTINLQPIGGSSSQQMYDDGSNGDQTAGDGIYSLQTTVASSTAPGLAGLVVTAADNQSLTASATISINIINNFSGDIGSSGGLTFPITNTFNGSNLNINYSGQITGTFSSLHGAPDVPHSSMRSAAACFPLLQILQPDGKQYGDKQPITNTKAEISIVNAMKGIWKCLITSVCPDKQRVSFTTSSSGTGLVSGMVIDDATGEGVDNAAVTTEAGGSTATDAGFYTLISPAGSFTIEASADTLGSAAKSVLLNAGEAVEINLALGEGSSNGGCAASSVLPGEKGNLALLRLFRDTVLKKTDAGAQYVRLYYRHSSEVSALLRKDPVLRAEARGGLLRALPLAVRLCSGRAAPMDAAQISAMARCLQKIAARGSTALKADMVKVLAQIEDQSIFKELGIAAEKAVPH